MSIRVWGDSPALCEASREGDQTSDRHRPIRIFSAAYDVDDSLLGHEHRQRTAAPRVERPNVANRRRAVALSAASESGRV